MDESDLRINIIAFGLYAFNLFIVYGGWNPLLFEHIDRAHQNTTGVCEIVELALEIICPLFAMEEVVPQSIDDG